MDSFAAYRIIRLFLRDVEVVMECWMCGDPLEEVMEKAFVCCWNRNGMTIQRMQEWFCFMMRIEKGND